MKQLEVSTTDDIDLRLCLAGDITEENFAYRTIRAVISVALNLSCELSQDHEIQSIHVYQVVIYIMTTFGAHAQRGYGSWVYVSLCLSVT